MSVKIDIVSGFLGAGKTTLIMKLVTELYRDERVVILENELGKVNIDSKVFRDSDFFVEEMTAGCICCSLKDDFMSSILRINEVFRPDRIIIEPTGAALLSEILRSYHHQCNTEFELDHIIAVIDVKRFETSLFISKGFIDNQIKSAKSVVLSKIDGNGKDEIDSVIQYIQMINQHANIAAYDWNQTSAQEIIHAAEHFVEMGGSKQYLRKNIKRGIMEQTARKSSLRTFLPDLDTWEAETDKWVSRERICAVFHQLHERHEFGYIARGKGILSDSEGWYQFDFVFGDMAVAACRADTKGKLCIIGTDLNRGKLIELFEL